MMLALMHRINQKEILNDQIRILTILMRVLARIKEGIPFKEAYCKIVDEYEDDSNGDEGKRREALFNRLSLRKYLKEYMYYQI